MAEASRVGLPIRNPWQLIDYASIRGQTPSSDNVEVLTHLSVIDCGLGDSPFGPPQELKQSINSMTTNDKMIMAIWKYPSDRFSEQPAILVRERFNLSDKPVIVFHGGGSYGLLAQLILELPDLTAEEELGILGIGPQFPNVVGLAKKHGQRMDGTLKFPYTSVKPDLNLSLSAKIKALMEARGNNNGRRFIYIDNPNNPTGDFVDLDTIKNFVLFAQSHNDVVIVDEAYGDAVPDEQSAARLTEECKNLIVLRGTAKIIGAAGARIGYGIFSREIGEIFQSLQLVFGVSGPQQLIINEILKPAVLKPHIESVIQKIQPLKMALVAGLERLGIWVAPSHPNVPIMLAVGPVDDFFQRLKRYQIVTERGSDFAATYPLGDSAVRIRVPGTIEEVGKILQRVEQSLKE